MTKKKKRIVFIGSAGSGKSTLSTEIFVELKKRGYNTELVSEFIRTDIHLHGPMQSIWEQYRTIMKQREIEDAVPDSVDWIITDSGTLTPYFYACLYSNKANERERLCLADIHKFLIDDLYTKRYTHVFFLPGNETYKNKDNLVNDGTRYQTNEELELIDEHMKLVFTKLFPIDNIYSLNMPISERINAVLKVLL